MLRSSLAHPTSLVSRCTQASSRTSDRARTSLANLLQSHESSGLCESSTAAAAAEARRLSFAKRRGSLRVPRLTNEVPRERGISSRAAKRILLLVFSLGSRRARSFSSTTRCGSASAYACVRVHVHASSHAARAITRVFSRALPAHCIQQCNIP